MWKAIKASRIFSKVTDKVFQDNAYFAHPENILLAMLTDYHQHIRELAVRRIMKARSLSGKQGVRYFKIPAINFFSEDYIEMIDWQKCVLSEPPLTMSLSVEELEKIISGETLSSFKKFPCHTQAVERCVKTVTEASQKACGDEMVISAQN